MLASRQNMSYTEMYMLGTMPGGGSLPSIGSSALNVARETDSSDSFDSFLYSTPEANSVRNSLGEGFYHSYVDAAKAAREAAAARSVQVTAKKAKAARSRIRKWLFKLKQAYTG
ncbi:hypothetical protein FQN50_003189 [Emmonsiellopsis sp. PD_5]|nr:hypothetical protein FQN50_003189 [Emmonsiellopsis sp. PD_5]